MFPGGLSSQVRDKRYRKVVSLSVLITGRLYPPGTAPGTHFCWKLRPTHDHIAAGRIMSTKTVNPTRDLPICRAVFQSTASPRATDIVFSGLL